MLHDYLSTCMNCFSKQQRKTRIEISNIPMDLPFLWKVRISLFVTQSGKKRSYRLLYREKPVLNIYCDVARQGLKPYMYTKFSHVLYQFLTF